MRAIDVVVVLPLRNQCVGIFEAGEPRLIEALVSESAIERLHESVLDRFAWIDEMKVHLVVAGPDDHVDASELWAVVHDNLFGQASLPPEALQDCDYRACPECFLDTSISKHSREKSSMIFNVLNLRLSDSVSLVKSIDHLSFGAKGDSLGVRLPH